MMNKVLLSKVKELEKLVNTIVEQKLDLEMRLEAALARETICDEKISGLEERISIMQESGGVEDPGVSGIVKSQRMLISQLRESVVQLNSMNNHNQTVINGIADDLLNQNSYQDILQRRFGIVSGTS